MIDYESNLPLGRRRLIAVIQHANDVIRIDDVVSALSIEPTDAAKLLSRWTSQGWLRRVKRGIYVLAELGLQENRYVLEDPWILVPVLYAPAYVGGFTACEYQDLTDQMFRKIFVMTARPVREKHQVRHGTDFMLRHIQEQKFFGTETTWSGRTKVLVSDVHRTMIDILDYPSIGGGFLHVGECFSNYLIHPQRNDDKLISYAVEFSNGAIFKRLGFLTEKLDGTETIVDACRAYMTKGNAKIDPLLNCPRLISKWRLWVPEYMATGIAHD